MIEAAALSIEDIQPGGRMVSRKVMTIDRFVPGARQPNQPPPSQGRSQVPQPPPSSRAGRAHKNKRSPINHPRAWEMLLSRLLPSQQGGSLSVSRRPRLVRGLRPPPKRLQRGSPSSCWTASLCLRPPVCGCGRKARVAVLPKLWPRVFFFPRTCTPLRRDLRSLWGAG